MDPLGFTPGARGYDLREERWADICRRGPRIRAASASISGGTFEQFRVPAVAYPLRVQADSDVPRSFESSTLWMHKLSPGMRALSRTNGGPMLGAWGVHAS